MSQFAPEPTTSDKLQSIVQGFDDFDLEMRRGTRLRREKDEHRIAELKTEMSRLDQELVVEVRRRTEMNKSTQVWFEERMDNINKQFRETIEAREAATAQRLEALNVRVDKLFAHVDAQKAAVLKYVDDRGEELTRLLNKFKAEFEEDRRLRLIREESIVKQLTDHEQVVADKFEEQIEAREARYNAVRAMLEENIRLRERSEASFQTTFDRELSRLRNDFQRETEARVREDDEIIEALNRYTLKLQTSLHVVNSTDM